MNFLVIPSSGVSLCIYQLAECFFLFLPFVRTISHMVGVHFFIYGCHVTNISGRYRYCRIAMCLNRSGVGSTIIHISCTIITTFLASASAD
jgi:hypothetical protein